MPDCPGRRGSRTAMPTESTMTAVVSGRGIDTLGGMQAHGIRFRAFLLWVVLPSVAGAQFRGVATEPFAEAYLKRGEANADAHKYDDAIADYNMAIGLRPDYAEAYNDRGHAYHWKGGNGDRAIADFTRAIELRPNYPTAYNNRGVVYMAGGHPAQAIAEFDRALELDPSFRNAYVNRANARLRLLHVGAALYDFHRAGMYPERTAAMLGALVLASVGLAFVTRRKRRNSR
jgi:tetratricopeptide (TPR) repeat protein